MKKAVALTFAASTLFLAGCCTVHHATIWEYKTVGSIQEVNQLASQGWTLAAVAPVHMGAGSGAGVPAATLDYVMKHAKQ